MSTAGGAGDPGPRQGGAHHVGGLGPQLGQRSVAVDAHPQVDLGDVVHAEAVGHVDQQTELDPVAGGEPGLVEHGAGGGGLARQGLAHARQMREEQVDDGPGHELGHPPPARRRAVQRALVEALHEHHVGPAVVEGHQERAEEAGHEVGREVLHVGVEEDEQLGVGLGQGHLHGLALPPAGAPGAHHPGPGPAGSPAGVVVGPVVDHHDVVHQVDAAPGGGEGAGHGGHDGSHGGGLVAGRQAHRHPPLAPGPGQGVRPVVAVVGGARPRGAGGGYGSLTATIFPHPGSGHAPTCIDGSAAVVHHGGIIQSG